MTIQKKSLISTLSTTKKAIVASSPALPGASVSKTLSKKIGPSVSKVLSKKIGPSVSKKIGPSVSKHLR